MKKWLLALVLMGFAGLAQAQLNPISWTFSAKKISENTYELQMKASIQTNWHLYSQTQPDDAVAMPTTFVLSPNPLFTLEGKIKEIGKMEKYTDKILKVSANQYSNTVTFTQVVKLKGKAKTSITGTVEYQTCDDQKCLPPKKVSFKVALG
ncbi:MAG TPA: protein-disulfide reductase DsbD family protein [Chitinophagaceae bacterium]|nr:protein-disulfide reductase DsbD family protein [Chitinophagaceae bacterium]